MVKLIYFNSAGRAELSRLLLAYSNTPYEFDKIEGNWPERKAELTAAGVCKFGQVPALVDGDFIVVQSQAIARYLAAKLGLEGKTLHERATADMFVQGVNEVFEQLIKLQFYTAEADRPAAFAKFLEESLPKHFNCLNGLVVGPFVLGDHASIADLALFDVVSHILKHAANALDAYPKLQASYKAVLASEGVAKYVASKPYGERHY